MKHLIILFLLVPGMLITAPVSAQSHVIIANGNHHPDYYYLPEIDIYYYIPRGQYVYPDGDHWVFSVHLPARYHDFDFGHGRRIYVEGLRPYLHHDTHYQQYHYEGNGHNSSHTYQNGYGNGHGNGHGSNGHDGGHH